MGIRVSIYQDDLPEGQRLNMDSEGTIILKFKLQGVRSMDDANYPVLDGEQQHEGECYELECELKDIKVREVSLREATERAMNQMDKEVRVVPRTSPAT